MKTKAGTPYYVAPQVLMGAYDEKCDIWSCGVIAYILLCGYPPFYGEKDEDILRRVKRGNFDFPSPDWDENSKNAKDFITKMLTYDPALRPSAATLLEHEWLKSAQNNPQAVGAVAKDLGTKLGRFVSHQKLKKVALTVIAQQLSDDAIEEMKKTFAILDKNNDGTLTASEIKDAMVKHKVAIPDNLAEILRQLDTDGSGTIDYTEFIAATMTTRQYLNRDILWAAFRTFDIDGDGKITKSELKRIIQDDQAVASIIKEVDIDGDEEISFDEFSQMMGK